MQRQKLTSREIDAKHVAIGLHIAKVFLGLLEQFHDIEELASMNLRKNGHPYAYTRSLMLSLAVLRYSFGFSYRMCEGVAQGILGDDAPDYTTICRRLNKMDVSLADGIQRVAGNEFHLTIIPDGTGLTPAKRGEYIRVAHKVRRGFVRCTIMVNHDTQEIINIKVTDERTGETVGFADFVEESLRNVGIDPEQQRREVAKRRAGNQNDYSDTQKMPGRITLKADGAYDDRSIFSMCNKLGIDPHIRIRYNANCRAGGIDRTRAVAAKEQLGGDPEMSPREFAALDKDEREANRENWKILVKYGRRWIVEIIFSVFKGRFGNAVNAKKMRNIVNELKTKAYIYNLMLRVGREGIMSV